MAFEKGNQFWKQRSKHGRDALFSSPELLWESACEYFEWCDNNPWIKSKKQTYDKGEFSGETLEEIPTQRPYTRKGFCIFIDASENWLKEFRKNASVDFLAVINRIENIIDNQQVDGAMVGVFNSNLVARIQGIKEQSDVTTNGESINKPLTIEEAKKLADELDNEY